MTRKYRGVIRQETVFIMLEVQVHLFTLASGDEKAISRKVKKEGVPVYSRTTR